MKLNKVKLLLIAICLPVVTAGCGTIKKDVLQTEIQQTVEKPEKVTLKLWGALNDKDLLATMVESFQKHYASEADFDITIEYVDEGECKATALKDVNNAADVFAFAGDQLSSLAASGLIEKISNEEQIKSQNSENSVAESSINQSLYAYPMTADNGYFMYY
ncbi:MAG: extracellular solute-binding protein, partial [Clostridium sp.]|nr:extracellular solute-binding protein [Clostridium sp.]